MNEKNMSVKKTLDQREDDMKKFAEAIFDYVSALNEYGDRKIQKIGKHAIGGVEEVRKYNGSFVGIKGGRIIASGTSCDLLHQNIGVADKTEMEISYVPKL